MPLNRLQVRMIHANTHVGSAKAVDRGCIACDYCQERQCFPLIKRGRAFLVELLAGCKPMIDQRKPPDVYG